MTKSKYNLETLFSALADRTRLRLINLLGDSEVCVCFLVEILKTSQPKISRHLAYLRRAELVVTRKHGQWTFYALAPAANPFHKKLLECLSKCFDELPQIQKDAARATQLKKAGGCCGCD